MKCLPPITVREAEQPVDDVPHSNEGSRVACETPFPKVLVGRAEISETKNDKPELRVVTDYDDFFKDYVDALVEQKAKSGQAFKVANIVIDAGPWRSYDVQIKQTSDTLLLDFHSPCRHRGGPDADDEILRAL